MSGDSDKSDSGPATSQNLSSQPRKRSKISRACDLCRRKKIRCDAEYSSTLQKVTKICTNCSKINEPCSFSRTPLKRGPSKGYIKDLEEKLESNPNGKPRLKLLLFQPLPPILGPPTSSQPPQSYQKQYLPFPPPIPNAGGPVLQVHKNSISSTNSASPQNSRLPIILPPLLYQSKVSPSSPQPSEEKKTSSPPIQGPFWKVPYEMPGSNNGAILNGMANGSRRSSIDSISSNSTTGLRSRLPSLKPSISINSDAISDSDDDFYSVKLHRHSSQSISPRNSVSSLLSLLGRMSKNLTIHGPAPVPPPPQPQISYTPYTKIPINPLDFNLKAYYAKFHPQFPILPFNSHTLFRLVDHLLLTEETKRFVDLFNLALNNLNYYQHQNLVENINLFHKVLALYPFKHYNIQVNDSILILFFSSLVLINYAILLNGDVYSFGISLAVATFNDFKVLENFADYIAEPRNNPVDPDYIKLYLPKLYFCLYTINYCYSLNYGIQPLVHAHFDLLYSHMDEFLPPNESFVTFKLSKLIHDLVCARNESVFSNAPQKFSWQWLVVPDQVLFPRLFVNLVRDKYELIDHLTEIDALLKSINLSDDESLETLRDYQLKLGRVTKKVTHTIVTLSNFVSTINSNKKSSAASSPVHSPFNDTSHELINPYFNLSYGQCYKLIKLCKLITDANVAYINDIELTNRSIKVNNDLSIAFNLLISNLDQRLETQQLNEVINCGLGLVTISTIKNRLDHYNFSFANSSTRPAPDNNFILWKTEFTSSIYPFATRERLEGWF